MAGTYHDQKAMRKPNQEKKKTLPCTETRLKIGMDRALWLIGLTSGRAHNRDGENIVSSFASGPDGEPPLSNVSQSMGRCSRSFLLTGTTRLDEDESQTNLG